MMKISSGKNQRTYPGEVDEVETIQYKRKKQKGRRQAILGQFRGEEMHHELDESACVCPDCLSQLKEIGSQVYRQEIVFIPAQLKRIDHIQHAYKCMACSAVEEQDKIIKAPVPKAPFKHSLGSASIISNSIEQKYNQKVPNYRQERYWKNLGLSITRKELSRWQNKASEFYFEPLYNLLHEKLLEQDVIHADETTYRVLESEKQTNFYWTFLSGQHEEKGITLFYHDERRSGQVAQEFLGDYQGYVHCDMWQAYQQLPQIEIVGCWAHVRRKFFEATPKKDKKNSLAYKGLRYCDQMFSLERSWADLSPEDRLIKRQEELKPLMDLFFKWCRQQDPLVGSKLGKALHYSMKNESYFRTVLQDGRLVLSNNLAERAIKSIVMGRKNWLFSQSFEGAKASAIIMSLIETGNRHGLNSEKYFTYLLEHLPNEDEIFKKSTLEAYLPWSEKIQATCV